MAYRDMCIEGKNVTKAVKALSSDIRLQILDLLEEEEMNVQALTQKLGLGKTTVLTHLNILEEAGFISTRYVPGSVGNQKMCRKEYDRLIFNFSPNKEEREKAGYFEISTPVGNYFDFDVYPPCGLASKDNVIKKWDDPAVFYDLERVKASLVWASYGYVEYKIPIPEPFFSGQISKLELLMEVSAQGDIKNHKVLALPEFLGREKITDGISDVTFWVNDVEVGSVTLKEYSRGSGGRYTPTWWKGSNYGELVRISIDGTGSFISGEHAKSTCIGDLRVTDHLRLRIGIKKDAESISGFNIYGRNFGNHDSEIVVRIYD